MSTDEIADAISMLESGIILEDWTDEFIASIIEAKEKRERGPVTTGDITGGDRSRSDIIAEQDAEYDEIVELEEERRLKVIADEEEEIQREAKRAVEEANQVNRAVEAKRAVEANRAVEAKRAVEASVEIKHPSLDELRRLRCMWFDKEVKKDN